MQPRGAFFWIKIDMSPTEVKEWIDLMRNRGVLPWEIAVSESVPEIDPDFYDYTVIYEISVAPPSLDMGLVHISVTDEGDVGIQFETYARILRRLRLWFPLRTPTQVVGHEPVPIERAALEFLLEVVAAGRLKVRVWRIGRLGFDVKAYLPDEDWAKLRAIGYMYLGNIGRMPKDVSRFRATMFSEILDYRPWSEAARVLGAAS